MRKNWKDGIRQHWRHQGWAVALLLGLILALVAPLALAAPGLSPRLAVIDWLGRPDRQALIQEGLLRVEQAAESAAAAQTASDWDRTMVNWMGAIATLQSIPADAPERPFVQRQQRQHLQQLMAAQRQAEIASLPYVFPSLGTSVLDEQLILYLSYVAAMGPPDVLIIGSSRAQQGLDPEVLQQALAGRRDLEPVRTYNLSVNGATAQVLNFVLQRLLTTDQLPRVVVWGTGSRGFNSARFDTTFANILRSPGYAAALAGSRPQFDWSQSPVIGQPSALTSRGFLPVPIAFEPDRYYQRFPRVAGRFDGFYNPFDLDGVQTVSFRSLVGFLKARQIEFVMVNLPLSGDFLDPFRQDLERRFQRFLQVEGERSGFQVVDLLTQWLSRNDVFADPSHLNAVGASAITRQLASHSALLSALNRAQLPASDSIQDSDATQNTD